MAARCSRIARKNIAASKLLSAGWIWHPVDAVRVFDVETALRDPSHLDSKGLGIDPWAEECSATFDPDNRVVVVLRGIERDDGGVDSNISEIHTFDVHACGIPKIVTSAARLGTLMAIGSRYLLGLYAFPRLIDMATGSEMQSWPHINSGLQTSSILPSDLQVPPIALDAVGQRCAIADSEGITVLLFDKHESRGT
jgi:hypothetical protein